MHDIQVKRHLDEADLAAVTELLAAASEADQHPALGEHAWLDLVQGGREGFAGLVAWEPGHSHPVGYAQVSLGPDPHVLDHGASDHADTMSGDRTRDRAMHGSGAPDGATHGSGAPDGATHGSVPQSSVPQGSVPQGSTHGTGAHGSLSWALELVVDPHHRTPGNTVAIDLVRSAVELIASEGGGHLHLWVNQPAPFHDQMAAASGLSAGRALYQMRRPLPAREHSTIKTRPYRLGQDDAAWLEVNNRAFAWHPEQGGWTAETLKARQSQPWFDPEGFLLYEENGRLAGFCWTKVHHGHHLPLGEIYVIAVDPDFSGQGLGRQLTLAGLDYLSAIGIGEAMLYVDSTNARAVKLYVDLGFTVNHIDRAYTGDVAPGTQPS